MLQNLISFFILLIKSQPLGLKITLLKLRKKQTILTPSTSGKCSSLTVNPMMLNFGKNLLHLLNKNCFKFDINPTVDLGGRTI
jgi:hypothetical protein